jgi:hypothetical protein
MNNKFKNEYGKYVAKRFIEEVYKEGVKEIKSKILQLQDKCFEELKKDCFKGCINEPCQIEVLERMAMVASRTSRITLLSPHVFSFLHSSQGS